MNDTIELQWGVFYEGRGIGFVPYDSQQQADAALETVDDKHLPAHIEVRALDLIAKGTR